MRLPKKVIIFGIPYKIYYTTKRPTVEDNKGNEEVCTATLTYETHKIHVFTGKRNKQSIMKSLWHEVIHAIFYEMKLWRECKAGWAEERIADGMASGISGLEFKYK